ncbi:unnamed protein product, partial [Rotaria sp. Silwood2]
TYQPQMQQEQIQNTNLTSINDWTTEPTSQVYEEPVVSFLVAFVVDKLLLMLVEGKY